MAILWMAKESLKDWRNLLRAHCRRQYKFIHHLDSSPPAGATPRVVRDPGDRAPHADCE